MTLLTCATCLGCGLEPDRVIDGLIGADHICDSPLPVDCPDCMCGACSGTGRVASYDEEWAA